MDIGPYEVALIGVGGIIAGTLLGAWLGYILSISLTKITERHKASLKLREAFKYEFLALDPSQYALNEELPIFLEKSFDKHREAIYDFSFYLKPDEKQKLFQAWYAYYCYEEDQSETPIPFFEKYSCRGLTTPEKHKMKKKVRERIEKILERTKYN